VDRDGVMRWVADYERAWRDGDVGGVERLFTSDVVYRRSPYNPPDVGHDAVKAFWRDDAGSTFTVAAEPVAVEADRAVVRLEVRYLTPHEQEYRDLWVLRFAPDGRVAEFEEWPYWPGQPYAAAEPE
jgi:ketosteroid isomerase-like protein